MPALNEEKNISSAIEDTIKALDRYHIKGEVVVINDGSSDTTPAKIKEKMQQYPDRVRMLEHDRPMGIGASFWDGVDGAHGEVVCMMPGDNENDPEEIIRYLNLMNRVDMVVPFIFNRGVRSAFRRFISFMYRFILNTTFQTSLNYTNGTVLYRRIILKDVGSRESGFFYQTAILIRLIKKGYLFAEVPNRLSIRESGESKALSIKSLFAVMKGYLKLFTDIYFSGNYSAENFVDGSVSKEQYARSDT